MQRIHYVVVGMLVSVIIPTYNRSACLGEAIASVLGQDMSDFELIIVDDGSTDSTKQICSAFGDGKLRYFFKTNGGVASARNIGIRKVRGEFVAFLDSDDIWPSNYLSVLTRQLRNRLDCGIAYCASNIVWPDGETQASYRAEHCKSGQLTWNLFHKSLISCQCALIRMSVMGQNRFDESLSTAEDLDFFLRMSLRTAFTFVEHVEVIRRPMQDSLSPHKLSKSLDCNKILVMERFYRHLGGKDLIPLREARKRLSNTYAKVAARYYRFGGRKASIHLSREAIRYAPFSPKGYLGLMKALLRSKRFERMPEWEMPPELPAKIMLSEADLFAPAPFTQANMGAIQSVSHGVPSLERSSAQTTH